MSTVPEVILARFLGLRVAAVSTVTNMAAGLSDEAISHEHTKAMAPLGAAKLERILRRFLTSALIVRRTLREWADRYVSVPCAVGFRHRNSRQCNGLLFHCCTMIELSYCFGAIVAIS
jgi:hypothetical protein